MKSALVVGGGPAGLMAADVLAQAGLAVTLCDAMPTVGRKFLMAGKSGLNLTRVEDSADFLAAFTDAAPFLSTVIAEFGPKSVIRWAQSLEQPVFTGSTGRVFPEAMKASPLLRAWLARLSTLGVTLRTRHRWTGFEGDRPVFDTPDGEVRIACDVAVLALGGASWSRLGSDGEWAGRLAEMGVDVVPFTPANAALDVTWSDHMAAHLGTPLKQVAWRAGPYRSRGEAVLSARGIEGGGLYSVSRGVREGHPLIADLRPDLTLGTLTDRLAEKPAKTSLTNHLRKAAGLDRAKTALLMEMARPLPTDAAALGALIKALPLRHNGLRPLDEAISTAGGVAWDAVDGGLMLRRRPGVFVAGEMLDWEAPTGGYLINACLASGRWAGRHAADYAASPRA